MYFDSPVVDVDVITLVVGTTDVDVGATNVVSSVDVCSALVVTCGDGAGVVTVVETVAMNQSQYTRL